MKHNLSFSLASCPRLTTAAILISVGGIGYNAPVHAQTNVLEEITVTAQKREQNLQDAAVAVTAFSGEALRELNFTNSVDVASQTPNFSIGTPVGAGNNPSIVLRGGV